MQSFVDCHGPPDLVTSENNPLCVTQLVGRVGWGRVLWRVLPWHAHGGYIDDELGNSPWRNATLGNPCVGVDESTLGHHQLRLYTTRGLSTNRIPPIETA